MSSFRNIPLQMKWKRKAVETLLTPSTCIIILKLEKKEATSLRKNRKFGKLILAGLSAQMILAAVPVQASVLDQLTEQEMQQEEKISSLESTIDNKLHFINQKKAEIAELYDQITVIEAETEETIAAIAKQKELIAARKDQLKDRLVALQVSTSTNEKLMMLLESSNLTEFMSRFYLLAQIQAADNERMEDAQAEAAELAELEAKLVAEKQAVSTKTAQAEADTQIVNEELASLQILLAENRTELMQILSSKDQEMKRMEEVARAEKAAAEKAAEEKAKAETIAAEKVAAEKAAMAAEQAATKTAEWAPEQPAVEEKVVVQQTAAPAAPAPAPAPVKPVSGRTLTVSATAYSRNQPGLSNFTATGIDLRNNPTVIAVDPSVIPLGSLVEVPGYGIAIAGDTGSAIKGHKIDLHMEDLNAAIAFGRRNITITVLG